MKIQEIASDVRGRAEAAGKQSQDAFAAYLDAQKKALGIVSKNGQSLYGTELGAAKNVYAAARSSFDRARKDGVRKVASEPKAYVPNGRDQIVSAYKDTIDLLVKTGDELATVVTDGYKTVRSQLTGKSAPKKKAAAASKSSGTKAKPAARKTAAKRTTSTTSASKRSTAKSSSAKSSNTRSSTARSSSTKTSSTKSSAGKAGTSATAK